MTSSLKEAFDTEEIDEEYLNDEAEDPLDRLQLAKSKLSSAHKVIKSHEAKIQTLTEDGATFKERLTVWISELLPFPQKDRFSIFFFNFIRVLRKSPTINVKCDLQATEDRLAQFKDLLAEKDSEIVQVAQEKEAEIDSLKKKVESLQIGGGGVTPNEERQFSAQLILEPDLRSSELKQLQQDLRSASDNDGFKKALLEALASIDTALVGQNEGGGGEESQRLKQEVASLKANLENSEVSL